MPLSPYANAISGIESGGRYDLLGPVTKGDRAYGRYQVMGSNIPSWTERYYGKSLTPQQFLSNPQAQDAVFQGQFGQYVNKYGPEGAARAWFAGEGGMNNPDATDVLGTSVADYSKQFTNNLGATPATYAGLNSPPLTPGSPAPPLPPPINVGAAPSIGAPTSGPMGLLAGLGSTATNPAKGLLSLAGLGGAGQQNQDTAVQPPQIPLPMAVRPQVNLQPLLSFLSRPSPLNQPSAWSV